MNKSNHIRNKNDIVNWIAAVAALGGTIAHWYEIIVKRRDRNNNKE